MGLFDWLFGGKKQKEVHVYINRSPEPIVFIPYSESDPSNVRLLPKTSKIVSFPGFKYSDFDCVASEVKNLIRSAKSIHICNDPVEQYYYDVASKTLFYRKQGDGEIKDVTPQNGENVEQTVFKLTQS